MNKLIRLAILVTLVLVLGSLPATLAAQPPGPPGSPTKIVDPLDPQGNVKTSIQGPLDPLGNVKVSVQGPVQVTATAPLPVSLPADPGPTLLTVAENLVLNPSPGPGNEIGSGWQDVKAFRRFKLYARITPVLDPLTQPSVAVRVRENAAGLSGEGYYTMVLDVGPGNLPWLYLTPTTPQPPGVPAPARWVHLSEFNGMFSKLTIRGQNLGLTPVTISLYLLMAKD